MQVLILHRQLEEELELRVVLENAVEHVSGPSTTTYPRNLPISVRHSAKEFSCHFECL